MNIVIVGAGAAGCFCAIQLKRLLPEAEVTVLEAGPKPLAKVAVTGGGRCNFTNTFAEISSLSEAYPRGERLMKRMLKGFDQHAVCDWFEAEGVPYVVQEDQCVFPASQDAMQIVNTLTGLMRSHGVRVLCRHKVSGVARTESGYDISLEDGAHFSCDCAVITTGGSPRAEGLSMLDGLGLETVEPVPSLFTFNITDKPLREMMGTVVEDACVSIPGTSFRSHGPLLITHWGLSGPAALKLSAYAARYLAERRYSSPVLVSWMGAMRETDLRSLLEGYVSAYPQKLVTNIYPQQLNSALWRHLVVKALGRDDLRWRETGRKGLNKLVETLLNYPCTMNGKSRFREEFVTCGGVALGNLNLNTLESKKHPHLYFAGEVLDVDAVTGGFNLQAAWSMGYAVAEAIARFPLD